MYRITGKRAQSERCCRNALRLFRKQMAHPYDNFYRSLYAAQWERMLARAPVYY